MADEPNKKVEKLLQDYAGERRKSGNVTLHPATRRMLQGEVRRTYHPGTRGSFRAGWQALWPKIAFGSGLALVLVVAVLSLRTPSNAPASSEKPITQQAQDIRLEREPLKDQPAVAEQETRLRALSLEDRIAEPTPNLVKEKDNYQSTPSIANAPAPEQKKAAAPEDATRFYTRSAPLRQEQLEAVTNLDKAAAKTERSVRANELTNLGAAMRVRFVELPDRTLREARPKLLTSFQLEQNGDDVKFHDADGSIYSGQLFPAIPAEPATAESAALSFTAPSTPPPPGLTDAAEHLFRVEGTNRALGKQVVVEGRYLERTNANPTTATQGTLSNVGGRPSASTAAASQRIRRAIIGRALVGQTNQVPVNAVSIEP